MVAADPYAEGIRLFNTGHYWHAHEQWEHCWLAAAGSDATFYKGIIQAAAALVKWQQHNQHGMRLNWGKSRSKLTTLPQYYMGLDVAALVAAMDVFVEHADTADPLLPPQLAYSEMARHS